MRQDSTILHSLASVLFAAAAFAIYILFIIVNMKKVLAILDHHFVVLSVVVALIS